MSRWYQTFFFLLIKADQNTKFDFIVLKEELKFIKSIF